MHLLVEFEVLLMFGFSMCIHGRTHSGGKVGHRPTSNFEILLVHCKIRKKLNIKWGETVSYAKFGPADHPAHFFPAVPPTAHPRPTIRRRFAPRLLSSYSGRARSGPRSKMGLEEDFGTITDRFPYKCLGPVRFGASKAV
jgi:hypothetical protein